MNENLDNIFDEDDDEDIRYITLTDDNGEDVSFEFVDAIDYGSRSFVVLLPFDETNDEVVILEVIDDYDDHEEYVSVHDEELLDRIFDIFKQRNSDVFNFE